MPWLKVLFWILIVLTVTQLFSVVTLDYDRLTEYGWGYLTGKAVLMIVFLTIAFLIDRSMNKNRE